MSNQNKSVCVTGAGGFIGSKILRRLSDIGTIATALLGPKEFTHVEPPGNVQCKLGEIDDLEILIKVFDGVNTIVHLAGPPSVAASFNDPIGFMRTHALGTATVLEACRRTNVSRIVYVSSAEVYGLPDSVGPVKEDARMQARSPYAASKIAAEQLIKIHAETHTLQAVILRPFSIYGPGARPDSLVPTILRQACASPCIEIFDPEVVRDYCFVEDLVRAVQSACFCDISEQHIICNVGTGIGTSASELARSALELLNRDIPIQATDGADRPQKSDIRRLIADPALILSILNWKASVSLQNGLLQTLKAI